MPSLMNGENLTKFDLFKQTGSILVLNARDKFKCTFRIKNINEGRLITIFEC